MNGVIAASGRYSRLEINDFSVVSQENEPNSMFFRNDGLMFFVVGWQNDTVYRYSLSTAWDINTATYDVNSFNVSSQNPFPVGLSFKSDGLKMYVLNATTDVIHQYSLSTAWDLSTASYDSVSLDVSVEESSSSEIYFRSDGLKMYVSGGGDPTIHQYSLSSAWDLSTASYDSVNYNTVQDGFPSGMFFRDNGLTFFMVGSNEVVYEYSLSSSWDLSTASYANNSFDASSLDSDFRQVFFSDDGAKMYLIGIGNDKVYEVTLSNNWQI